MPDDPAVLTAAWFDAWRAKDAGAIGRMMAAEYVYVAPNGAVMDREAILAIASDPSYGITDGAHTEVEVIPLGANVAVSSSPLARTRDTPWANVCRRPSVRDDLASRRRSLARSLRAGIAGRVISTQPDISPHEEQATRQEVRARRNRDW